MNPALLQKTIDILSKNDRYTAPTGPVYLSQEELQQVLFNMMTVGFASSGDSIARSTCTMSIMSPKWFISNQTENLMYNPVHMLHVLFTTNVNFTIAYTRSTLSTSSFISSTRWLRTAGQFTSTSTHYAVQPLSVSVLAAIAAVPGVWSRSLMVTHVFLAKQR